MDFLKQYEILVKKAITDLKVAKNIFRDFEKGDEELDLDVIMFHLQQSAEKLLKSLIIYNNIHYTKIHDIEILINIINQHNINIIENIEMLIPLTEYAVEGRYAIILDDVDDIDKYIVVLDELLEFVKQEIKTGN